MRNAVINSDKPLNVDVSIKGQVFEDKVVISVRTTTYSRIQMLQFALFLQICECSQKNNAPNTEDWCGGKLEDALLQRQLNLKCALSGVCESLPQN
jgi:hypothetical protein